MLKRFLMTVISLVTLSYSVAHAANIPESLLTMPIELTSGEVVTLKQYQGVKPVYLKFWATWCQPCRQQMPHFEDISQQYGDDLMVIAINLGVNDDLAAVRETQKEFNLTMPMAIDTTGDLAQGFRLLGTPYHLLFDKQMNLVHIGHQADSVLDNKIALINNDQPLDLLADKAITETEIALFLNLDDSKTHALFFSATWCDWYLKSSRPLVSQQCIRAQQVVNKLAIKSEKIQWQGVISRLWTGAKELKSYVNKYSITYPIAIDASNELFHQYTIKDLPSLVVVKNGKVLYETSNFSNTETLAAQLLAISAQ